MAGELRREDIGIGFNIDYPKLEKLDTNVDKIIDKVSSLGHQFEPVNREVGAFGRTFIDTIDKMIGADDRLKSAQHEVNQSIQGGSKSATTFRDKISNLNNVSEAYTSTQKKRYSELESSITGLLTPIGKVGRELRDLPKETVTKVKFDTDGVKVGANEVEKQTRKVGNEMDKTAKKSRRLKDIIAGSFAGTMISNGVMALTNGLHEAAQAGMEYNKEQDTMKTVWTSLTTEAPKDGKNLVKYINSMSQHSIYAADSLNRMAQSFYHVHSNEKETKAWTNDFIALGSTLHMSNDALAEAGEQFSKIVAGGKASSEDMAVMIQRFPMFGEALQKATGKSMKQLYAMSAAGKLSAKQFTDTLTYLGKKYEGGTKEAMTSFMGMSMYLKSRFSTLAGDVMKTSFNMDKQTAKSMQDLLKDDMMKKYAKGISSALGVVTGAAVDGISYLDKHKDTILDVMKNIGDIGGIFGKAVWTDSIDILTDIGDAFGLVDKNGKAAKDPLDQLDDLLKGIDQHKGAIKLAAKAMVGFFAVKKATQFLKMLKEINTQLKLTTALDAADSYQGILFGGGKGKRAGGGKSSSKVATKIEEAIESGGTAGGRHFAKEAKKGGTAAGKTGGRGFATKIKNGAKVAGRTGGGLFSDAIHNIAWMTIASKFATDGSQVFLDGISTKKGAKAAWKLGGDTVGGAIGFYLGGPAGAAVGTYIGGAIADQLSKWADWYQKNGTASPAGDKSDHQRKYNSKHTAALTNSLSTNATGGPIGTVNTKSTYPSESHGILNPSGITSKKKKKKSIVTKPITGFASGGPTIKPGMAMVAEAGTEIGYDARSGKYQIFDHGPQLVHLTAGMHIMNHRDSLKAMRGGLGRGRILPGYAKGTGSVGAASVATTVKVKGVNDATMKNTEYKTKRSADQIGIDIVSGYGKGTKGAQKKLTGLNKKSNQILKDTKNGTNKQTDLIRKQMIADFDAAQKGADKQLNQLKNVGLKTMDKMQDGMAKADQTIVSDFGNNFGKLPGLAKSSMKGAITNLNNGFTGIDSALSQFGGNKSVLKPIHYAAGSNGPIASDQIAVLNDATAGPRQELLFRDNQLLKPIGNDVVVPLKKGDEIFSGSQVERAKPYLPHFAKGTGASDDKLRSIASTNSGNPGKAFNKEFSVNVKLDGSALQKGTANTAKAGAKTVGVPWENAMWGYIQGLISGAGGGGPVLHSPGAGWQLTSGFGNRGSVGGGFSSHDGNDFSGAKTVHALQDSTVTGTGTKAGWEGGNGIGEFIATKGGNLSLIYQELNGKSGSGATLLVHTGDHVKQGQPIAKLGPSGTHVHIGASTEGLWSHGGSSTKGWLDVTKLHGNYVNKEKKSKTSGALTKLVTKQLGKSAAKWIENHLQDSDTGSGGTSAAPTGSHKHWLEQAGIPSTWWNATNEIISKESGWNPKAANSSGAYGLPQALPGSKMASAGSDWKTNPITQLKWYKSYIKSRYGTIDKAFSFRHIHNWYENGGFSKKHKLAEISEGNKLEAIVPMAPDKKQRRKDIMNKIDDYTGERRVQPVKVAASAGGRNVTIKMTNNIKVEGGNGQNVEKQVVSGMSKVTQQLADMLRRATGTDQGEGGLVI
ncbi:tape measure protein [Levilactobacillus brevis]|uniref:aggregation-promoting factor C-terminal-like domain-containing protein n=1 Tax=Levilactobacillus brevis TaxID=1580 RepID=UPI001C1217AD|nr:tape measure protein [Levilactobacillus brevis]MBU5273776.1 tape measure protein [Levilactobacillus brevis]